ncbi:hypothetical protein HanHA89_Chr11g0447231 [Helianthus annuus]|nr:hypothetical protein HanHA89_Chr11g0447231 [Helianthus annuus]
MTFAKRHCIFPAFPLKSGDWYNLISKMDQHALRLNSQFKWRLVSTGPKTYQGDQEVCTKSHGNHNH